MMSKNFEFMKRSIKVTLFSRLVEQQTLPMVRIVSYCVNLSVSCTCTN
jgi:hypothetical protein